MIEPSELAPQATNRQNESQPNKIAVKTPNPDNPIRNTLKHLALAFALGVGLGAGSALAQQPIIEVGGAGIIYGHPLATAKVPAKEVNWTAVGGGGITYSSLTSPTLTVPATHVNGEKVTLKFTHRYNFEDDWDGGEVFVNLNGAGKAYLPKAAFSQNGYTFDTLVGSVWTGGEWTFSGATTGWSTGALVETIATVGPVNQGDTIAITFKGGWDDAYNQATDPPLPYGGPGPSWEIATFQLSDSSSAVFSNVNFTADGASEFTAVSDSGLAGPWEYPQPISKFEINADDLTADQYSLPAELGTVIDLNNATLSVVLLSGTLDPGETFALFDLASGTTLTGAIDSISLPAGTWNTTNLAVNGTITYVGPPPPPECPLGVWKQSANGGINPATGVAWAVGDTYRLAFVTSGTTNFLSTDITTYNTFVQGVAAASTTFPKLGNGTWKVLGSTQAVNAKVNTGTNEGPAVSVLLMDGTTVLATSNADLWNGPNVRSTGGWLSIYTNENGVDVGNVSVGTGTNISGNSSQPFGTPEVVFGLTGSGGDNHHWIGVYYVGPTANLPVYALSAPLTLQAFVVATPYGDWAGGPFPSGDPLTDPDPALDFDHGGLPTGIEWVVGGDPTDGSDDAGKAPTLDNTTDPNNFLFIFRRTTAAGGDANTSIVAQYSSDLSGWTPAQNGVDGVTITPETGGFGSGIDKVTVAIPRTLALNNKLFVRLNVVVTTP